MYSDSFKARDGAGHARRDDQNSSRVAVDTTLDDSWFNSQAVLGKNE